MSGTAGMTAAEARVLLADTNLITVGARGDEARRACHGARTTFVRVFEVHVDAIPASLPVDARPGEVRLIGRPGSPPEAADAVRRALTVAGGIPLTAFSLAELLDICNGDLSQLVGLCRTLRAEGLVTIAEAPLDRLVDAARAIVSVREAGLAVPRLTVHGGSANAGIDGRLAILDNARALQSRVGGIAAFAPLPRVSTVSQPSTGYDDVRQIAVARLLVDNIDHIQVDWALYGPKLAQVALTMGADDVDGVSPLEGDMGRRRSPLEEIRGNITAAGLEPVERDGAWGVK